MIVYTVLIAAFGAIGLGCLIGLIAFMVEEERNNGR